MFQRGINLDSEANFLREAEILVELEHKNIIQLFGTVKCLVYTLITNYIFHFDDITNCVCVPLDPLSFLIEYMPYGDLNSFLRKYANGVSPGISTVNGELSNPRNLTVTPTSAFYKQSHEQYTGELTIKTLIEMIIDACEAMVYLSEVYYVHRDVATRSFLVGSKLIVKLSDFSLCRPVEPDVDFVSTSNESVPIKWLPVESILNGRFHLDTDVWSFGVFLWEVFSFAAEPFAEKSYEEVCIGIRFMSIYFVCFYYIWFF
ncbi:unnamed protein product [Trichobilharzia regenti]|nr:unnamed protein product [Trichobilharzia regenti]